MYQDNLRVKKSLIPDAGFGLYTTVPRSVGEPIAPYTGNIVVDPTGNYGGDYVLQIKNNPPTYIDARHTNTSVARYANSNRGGVNNAQLTFYPRQQKATLRARARIRPNEEIYTAYGRGYWN